MEIDKDTVEGQLSHLTHVHLPRAMTRITK